MRLSDLPAALQSWLNARLPSVITLTKEPALGEHTLHIPPVTAISYEFKNGRIEGTCTQAVLMQIGLPGRGLYSALDLPSVNALYQGLSMEFLLRGRRILADIITAEPGAVAEPIAVEESASGKGWIVTLLWSLALNFEATSENYEGIDLGTPRGPGVPYVPFDPTNISLALWKAKTTGGDIDDAVLDYGDREVPTAPTGEPWAIDYRNATTLLLF